VTKEVLVTMGIRKGGGVSMSVTLWKGRDVGRAGEPQGWKSVIYAYPHNVLETRVAAESRRMVG
jgi:hypothetical protein